MIDAALVQKAGVGTDVDPPVLQHLVERAIEFVQTQTRRYFGPTQEWTEYLIGSGSRVLRLPEAAAAPITAIEERPFPGDDPAVIADTDFLQRDVDTITHLVRKGGVVWTDGYEYAVTFQRGYGVGDGPKDIEQLILDLIALRLANVGREGLLSETIGGYSYSRPAVYAFTDGDLKAIPGAFATIEQWRRLVLA